MVGTQNSCLQLSGRLNDWLVENQWLLLLLFFVFTAWKLDASSVSIEIYQACKPVKFLMLYVKLLYCFALYCMLLYCIVLFCIVLFCIVLCWVTLHCIVSWLIIIPATCTLYHHYHHSFIYFTLSPCSSHRLVGLVVKASALRAEDPGFESCLCQDFYRGQVIPVT